VSKLPFKDNDLSWVRLYMDSIRGPVILRDGGSGGVRNERRENTEQIEEVYDGVIY
jgi:hypothetical protein